MIKKIIKRLLTPIVREIIAQEELRIKEESRQAFLEELEKTLGRVLTASV